MTPAPASPTESPPSTTQSAHPAGNAAGDDAGTRVRVRPRWLPAKSFSVEHVTALSETLHLPAVVCRLLVARGHSEAEAAKRYLRPKMEQLHEPGAMKGLSVAVERLARAARNGETVMIHGDYDVDGICSTTLLVRTLRHLGAKAMPFIPRRVEDGYDLTEAGVRAAVAMDAKVVVTCDCGTTARGPVEMLCKAGIDVIVTDHHLPGGPLPECLAVINPKQPGCEYPDKDLAAVGIAFKLALALVREMGGNENFVLHMLDLVALATIADIAPLRGENRIFARYGLKVMAETRNIGLRALIRSAGLEGKQITAGRVGFILAPRLNAVGRLGHAIRGVELMLAESEGEANVIARELEELNRRRQDMDKDILAQARVVLASLPLDRTFGVVLASDKWHPGVIGIVASRVVEEIARPTVLVALKDGEGKGSGRSIPAFDLHAGLGECRDLLVRFGGHKAAAGITIDAKQLDEFAFRFNTVARARLTEDDLVPELRVDLELSIDDANEELESLLRHFEPFGMGNPSPVLVARGVKLAGPARVVGADGLKLRLSTTRGELEALGWGMAHRGRDIDVTRPIDIAFRLERDEYQGNSKLVAKISDFL